jgi:MFS family permease
MLEERLHIDPSLTQRYTTALLTGHGFIGLVSAPVIAYFAEKSPSQKKPLLVSLAGCLVGTLMIAFSSSGMAQSRIPERPNQANHNSKYGLSSLGVSCKALQVLALG